MYADHHSEATPLRGSLLLSKLELTCRELTEHIAAVTGQRQRIARCVLNFKVMLSGKLRCPVVLPPHVVTNLYP